MRTRRPARRGLEPDDPVSAGVVALMALIAGCGLWAGATTARDAAAPFARDLVATAGRRWIAAAMAARAIARADATAEARLRAAAEALPDGLVVCDRDDRIVFYNSRYPAI